MEHPCTFCGGSTHPATGCVYGPRTIACRACVECFWKWFAGHSRWRPKRAPEGTPNFYEAATKHRTDTRPFST